MNARPTFVRTLSAAWLPVVLLCSFLARYNPRRVATYPEMLLLSLAAGALLAMRRHLALLALLLFAQHFYFGGAGCFPQLFFPRSTARLGCAPQEPFGNVQPVLLWTDERRRDETMEHLRSRGVEPSLLRGAPRVNGTYANLPPLAQEMLARKGKWLLLLEEDARLHAGFRREIECAARAGVDAVWLDARTDFIWKTRGELVNIAGLLVSRGFADAAIEQMRLDNPVWAELNSQMDPWWAFVTDRMYAHMCLRQGWRCDMRPIVSERW